MDKQKWLLYLPTVLYIAAAIFFITYVFIQNIFLMIFGAILLCVGSVVLSTTKQDNK